MKSIVKVKIGKHIWSVRRLPPEDMDWQKFKMYGYTWDQHRAIDILDTLSEEDLPLVIKHEVVHALLDTQGRRYQKKFDVEEVCEFIAWNIDEINKISNEIINKFKEKN